MAYEMISDLSDVELDAVAAGVRPPPPPPPGSTSYKNIIVIQSNPTAQSYYSAWSKNVYSGNYSSNDQSVSFS